MNLKFVWNISWVVGKLICRLEIDVARVVAELWLGELTVSLRDWMVAIEILWRISFGRDGRLNLHTRRN